MNESLKSNKWQFLRASEGLEAAQVSVPNLTQRLAE